MCSQFKLKAKSEQIIAKLGLDIDSDSVSVIDEHIYPYTKSLVVVGDNDKLTLKAMSYSLVPTWSEAARPKWSTYNARLDRFNNKIGSLERIYDLPTWRDSFSSRHCLVPLTGFIESCSFGSHAGKIVEFNEIEDQLLFAAGIWDSWMDKFSGEVINSFAIITDDPVPFFMQVGHDRQPVFLEKSVALNWVNSRNSSPPDSYKFLKENQQLIQYKTEILRSTKRNLIQADNDLFS